MNTITINVNDEALAACEEFAGDRGISVQEYVKSALFEQIENDDDVKEYNRAIEECKSDPQTYSHAELYKMSSLIDV